jgi:hypothetical protein
MEYAVCLIAKWCQTQFSQLHLTRHVLSTSASPPLILHASYFTFLWRVQYFIWGCGVHSTVPWGRRRLGGVRYSQVQGFILLPRHCGSMIRGINLSLDSSWTESLHRLGIRTSFPFISWTVLTHWTAIMSSEISFHYIKLKLFLCFTN